MKLYYKAGACSLAAHIILHEINTKFQLEAVDLRAKETASGEDFLQVNPKGYIPALELDNGVVITENFAILNYLSDLQPAKDLTQQNSNGLEIYEVYAWLNFIATELHKNFVPLVRGSDSQEWVDFAVSQLHNRFDYTNQKLAGRQFLVSDHFTVADAYLFTVIRWARHFLADVDVAERWPELDRYQRSLAERESVRKALKAEGIEAVPAAQ